jgi:hypothetical protein
MLELLKNITSFVRKAGFLSYFVSSAKKRVFAQLAKPLRDRARASRPV